MLSYSNMFRSNNTIGVINSSNSENESSNRDSDEICQPFMDHFTTLSNPPVNLNIDCNPEHLHLTFLLDRSGSMCTFSSKEIIKSVKSFIEDQIASPDINLISLTIISFDDTIRIIFDDFITSIQDVVFDESDILPRRSTALNEATAFTIKFMGNKFSHWGTTMPEKSRPGKVVFATMTDGEENTSFGGWNGYLGKDKIKKIVEDHKTKYNWSFFLLAANIDSNILGREMGYDEGNCMDFHTSNEGYDMAFRSCSQAVTENRHFSQEERTSSIAPNRN